MKWVHTVKNADIEPTTTIISSTKQHQFFLLQFFNDIPKVNHKWFGTNQFYCNQRNSGRFPTIRNGSWCSGKKSAQRIHRFRFQFTWFMRVHILVRVLVARFVAWLTIIDLLRRVDWVFVVNSWTLHLQIDFDFIWSSDRPWTRQIDLWVNIDEDYTIHSSCALFRLNYSRSVWIFKPTKDHNAFFLRVASLCFLAYSLYAFRWYNVEATSGLCATQW